MCSIRRITSANRTETPEKKKSAGLKFFKPKLFLERNELAIDFISKVGSAYFFIYVAYNFHAYISCIFLHILCI